MITGVDRKPSSLIWHERQRRPYICMCTGDCVTVCPYMWSSRQTGGAVKTSGMRRAMTTLAVTTINSPTNGLQSQIEFNKLSFWQWKRINTNKNTIDRHCIFKMLRIKSQTHSHKSYFQCDVLTRCRLDDKAADAFNSLSDDSGKEHNGTFPTDRWCNEINSKRLLQSDKRNTESLPCQNLAHKNAAKFRSSASSHLAWPNPH